MSIAAPAAKPPTRRMLEKQGMTREQELDLLIREQAADDTHRQDHETRGGVSLDAPASGGTVGSEYVGYDPWELVDDCIDLGLDPAEVAYSGPIVEEMPRRRGDVLTDPQSLPHGTKNGYVNHKCRCPHCTTAWNEYMAAYRARKAA